MHQQQLLVSNNKIQRDNSRNNSDSDNINDNDNDNNNNNHNASPTSSLFPAIRSKGITAETTAIATMSTTTITITITTTTRMHNAFYLEGDVSFLYHVLASSCFP